jgi:hypothetical protein
VSIGNDGEVLPPFPHVRQPLVQLACGRGWEVDQKLRQIELRVNLVPPACRSCPSSLSGLRYYQKPKACTTIWGFVASFFDEKQWFRIGSNPVLGT